MAPARHQPCRGWALLRAQGACMRGCAPGLPCCCGATAHRVACEECKGLLCMLLVPMQNVEHRVRLLQGCYPGSIHRVRLQCSRQRPRVGAPATIRQPPLDRGGCGSLLTRGSLLPPQAGPVQCSTSWPASYMQAGMKPRAQQQGQWQRNAASQPEQLAPPLHALTRAHECIRLQCRRFDYTRERYAPAGARPRGAQ